MWLIIAGLVLLLLYIKNKKCHNYWKAKGVPCLTPVPLFGNSGPTYFQNKPLAYLSEEWFTAYPNERYVGFYEFLSPKLLIRDPELIKTIAVKNYETFLSRGTDIPEGLDSLWDKNLVGMTGKEEWHKMRSTLSPAFTGSKMKAMFALISTCAKQFTDYLKNEEGTITIEVQDTFKRLSTDIIATTAFGIACNSFEDKENLFLKMGQKVKKLLSLKNVRFLILIFCPTLAKIFGIHIYPDSVRNFFLNIVTEIIKVRTEKGIIRPDMIHLLMEARKGHLKYEDPSDEIPESGFAAVQESKLGRTQKKQKLDLTDEDITAQALFFFVAGSEIVNFMSFALYELAVNPDVQKKLQQEVDSTRISCSDGFTYESLMRMNYLDMVISESLRKWPAVPMAGRVSSRPFTIEAPEGKSLRLEANSTVSFPMFAIHRCPEYYPNPETFNPERFSNENKKNIKPYTFLPFGLGPRNCIGSRFALLQSKLLLAKLVSEFEVVPVEKTQIPMQIENNNFAVRPAGKVWLGFKPRT